MLFKKSLFLLIFCSVLCRALYLPEQIFIPRDRDVTSTNQLPEVVEGEAAPALKVDEMVAGNCHDGDPDSCFPAVAGLDEGVEVDRRARRNAADELPDHVVVGEELQTVGKMVEEAYNEMPRELADIIVEGDIVNDEAVQSIRASGLLPGETETTSDYQGNNRVKRGALRTATRKWKDGRIPYCFQSGISNKNKASAIQAMDEWARYTCIKFVEKTENDTDYIFFLHSPGCFSHVGKVGGDQQIAIGTVLQPGCTDHGTLLHELGHSIGFFHEQARPDRDEYVRVFEENIILDRRSEFRKYETAIDSLGSPYDYNSIMHYPKDAFARSGTVTMEPLDPEVLFLGQSYRLSPLDIMQANLYYNCPYVNNTDPVDHTLYKRLCSAPYSFLIRNEQTDTCLSIPATRPLWPDETYAHHMLYRVISQPCNASSPLQRWQWTNTSALLHSSTFLCLGAHEAKNRRGLVLRTCKESDHTQRWNCAGNFIKQPDTEECVTVDTQGRRAKRSLASTVISRLEHKRSVLQNWLEDDTKGRDEMTELTRELETVIQELNKLRGDAAHRGLDSMPQEAMMVASASVNDDINTYNTSSVHCQESNAHQVWSIMDFNCEGTPDFTEYDDTSICSGVALEGHKQSPCYVVDMAHLSSLSNRQNVWAECTQAGYYVKGFYHTFNIHNYNRWDSGMITGIQCCAGNFVFTGEHNVPVVDHSTDECFDAEWWVTHRYLFTWGWFPCPPGQFLKGLQLSTRGSFKTEYVIKRGRCCKPRAASSSYLQCHKTVVERVADTGVHACQYDGFFVTTVEQSKCDFHDRQCKEEITCCMS